MLLNNYIIDIEHSKLYRIWFGSNQPSKRMITIHFCNIYIYISSSSSSCGAASTDIPDPLSPRLPIIHRLWQVFRVTSCIIT